MVRFRLSFVLILCMVLYGGTASLQEQNVSKGGTVEGRIIDTTLLERPISSVRVVFVRADGTEFETESDAKGEYKQTCLPPGRYLVSIYKSGYEDRLEKPVSVIEGGRYYVPLTMNKSENIMSAFQNLLGIDSKRGGVIRFWVHSRAKPVVPINGVEIKVTSERLNSPIGTGISNADGQYRSDRLPPGGYMVTISKNNYYAVCPITVYENKITNARIKLPIPSRNADSNVPPAQESNQLNVKNIIRGKIREMVPFETKLSGVKVVIKSVSGTAFSGTSNANGEYECIDLPAGRYLINLHKEGYIDKNGIPIIVANNGNHIVAVIEEGMFVSYAVVANGNLLELTHGMRKR